MPANSYTSSSKTKFLKRSLLLLALLIVLDQAVGLVMHKLYFSTTSGEEFETTYAFTKVKADVIITGSSKARRNYNTPLISDSLKLSCYNGGHDGQSLFYSYAMTKMLLAHHTPKMIVVEIFPEEFYYKEVHYDRLNILLPYYSDYEQVREIAHWRGTRNNDTTSVFYHLFPFNTEKIKLLSQSYRYNSLWFDLFTARLKKQNEQSGFLPLKKVLTESEKQKFISDFEQTKARERDRHIDANKVKALVGIINACHQKNVKVAIVMSPVLKKYDDDPVYQLVETIALSYNISLFDFTGDARFNHIKYFADNHMNQTGATYFSSVLAQQLKNILNIQP